MNPSQDLCNRAYWTAKISLQFNATTFRDDYSFRNSDWAIKRFPFPFDEDSYMYAVNMEQHLGGPEGLVYENRFDVDEHYVCEMRARTAVELDADGDPAVGHQP